MKILYSLKLAAYSSCQVLLITAPCSPQWYPAGVLHCPSGWSFCPHQISLKEYNCGLRVLYEILASIKIPILLFQSLSFSLEVLSFLWNLLLVMSYFSFHGYTKLIKDYEKLSRPGDCIKMATKGVHMQLQFMIIMCKLIRPACMISRSYHLMLPVHTQEQVCWLLLIYTIEFSYYIPSKECMRGL